MKRHERPVVRGWRYGAYRVRENRAWRRRRTELDGAVLALRAELAKKQTDAIAAAQAAEEAKQEAIDAEWRLSVVVSHAPDTTQTVDARVRTFLAQYPHRMFSPREIMAATRAGEDSVRRVLVTFAKFGQTADAVYVRDGHAKYSYCPQSGLESQKLATAPRGR